MKASPSEGSPEVAPEHYYSRAYNSKERVCSFWHQVDEVLEMGAEKVLEVGPGGGFVTRWLREAGVEVLTLDMDPALCPDLVASVTEMPLEDSAVDAVVCCQVLEHLPFEQLRPALSEIGRVVRLGAVISLPDVSPWLGAAYPLYFGLYADQARREMPKGIAALRALLGRRLRLRDYLFARLVPSRWAFGDKVLEPRHLPIPHGPLTPDDFESGNAHCYEIGMVGYPLERIVAEFEAANLPLERRFRVPENPWHHFFVGRPRGAP